MPIRKLLEHLFTQTQGLTQQAVEWVETQHCFQEKVVLPTATFDISVIGDDQHIIYISEIEDFHSIAGEHLLGVLQVLMSWNADATNPLYFGLNNQRLFLRAEVVVNPNNPTQTLEECLRVRKALLYTLEHDLPNLITVNDHG